MLIRMLYRQILSRNLRYPRNSPINSGIRINGQKYKSLKNRLVEILE